MIVPSIVLWDLRHKTRKELIAKYGLNIRRLRRLLLHFEQRGLVSEDESKVIIAKWAGSTSGLRAKLRLRFSTRW